MNILYYYTSNKFTVGGISVMAALKQEGHQVFFLSQEPPGKLHEELEKKGIPCFSSSEKNNTIAPQIISEVVFVSRFIKKRKINIVMSHLGANLPSVFVRFFVKANVYVFRHHTNEVIKYGNFKGRLGQCVINRLAYRIVSPCENVTKHLLSEGVSKKKIIYIPYGYDFSMYPAPDAGKVKELRDQYSCRMLLTVVARHVPAKRHFELLRVLAMLIKEKKMNIKCLLLDQGPLTTGLKEFVVTEKLSENIFFIGYTNDVVNYIAAADFVPHISESEASNSVIKEAGMLGKIVAVCRGVGDFDDYIEDTKNGFILDIKETEEQLAKVVTLVYDEPEKFKNLGQQLKSTVTDKFNIKNVVEYYGPIISDGI